MKKEIKLLIMIFVVFSIFFILNYPSVDDFIYGNMKNSFNIEQNAVITNYNIPGFDVLNTTISMLCNIPYTILPTIPFQILPLIFLLLSTFLLLSKTENKLNETLVYFIVGVYLLSAYSIAYIWNPHICAMLILLALILITIFRLKNERDYHLQTSIIFIIGIISLNFLSYKLTFIALMFFIFLQIFNAIESKFSKNSPKNTNLKFIILMGTVFTLFFNKFIYNSFIPSVVDKSEFSSPLFFDKLFKSFLRNPNDPLSTYYFSSPHILSYLTVIFLICVLIIFLICFIIVISKFIQKKKFSISEKIFSSMSLSTLVLFVIYAKLGLPDFGLLILTTFFGYITIFQLKKWNKLKIMVFLILILMLLVTLASDYQRINNNFYQNQRDYGSFQYLNYPSNWLNINLNPNSKIESDVLTIGYFSLIESISGEKTDYKRVISQGNILNILKNKKFNNKYFFIINNKTGHFDSGGWYVFKSWSNYQNEIHNNNNLNIIYTSGDTEICLTN